MSLKIAIVAEGGTKGKQIAICLFVDPGMMASVAIRSI